jgi:epoxide hydrolase-like predicted phosphatase
MHMAIRAVVFDIGGVLEITPPLGTDAKWEQELGLNPGDMSIRLLEVWKGGSIGTITLTDVHQQIGQTLNLDESIVNAYMDDVWIEYLGTLNVELYEYFRSLRPRYKTGILSNSFVGAREKEEEHYRFSELVDVFVYSHEVGISKPDPRIYKLTCERLGIQPHEMIFLDDREGAITPALELGIHGIVFHDNAQAIADINALLAR